MTTLKLKCGLLYDAHLFYSIATATAIGAEMVSRSVETVSSEEAFLAGLFQDVGVLVCAKRIARYQEFYLQSHPAAKSLIDADRKIFKTSHMAISHLLAKQWALSKRSCDAVLLSHSANLSEYAGLARMLHR